MPPLCAITLLIALTAWHAAAGPSATSAAGPDGTAGEDAAGLLRVTVVVTDRAGRPLAGLKPTDFDVRVDGQIQQVQSAELAGGSAAARRVFAFLLDEFHVAPEDSDRVREALLHFADRHLRPHDLTLVVKPLDPLTSLAPSADREDLRRAFASFAGRKGDYAPRTEFERQYMAQAPQAVAASRAQIVTAALRAIAAALGTEAVASAKPVIVLVSDGFGRTRAARDTPASLQAAVRIANRADAPVYAFAPGLAPPRADAPADPAYEALSTLASQTGGDLAAGQARLASGLDRMVRDLGTHYLLTYRPTHERDGRFHTLAVSVRREGATVRARAGYLAPAPPLPARAEALPAAPRVLRRSPLIEAWAGFQPTVPGRGIVALTWEPSPPRAGTAARTRVSTVVVTASAPDGTPLFDAALAPVAGRPGSGSPNAAIFEAPLGPIRIDMKLLDEKGVVIDTDARDVVPPAAREGFPTIFPPAVLRARSAREFRDLRDSPAAAPAAGREFRRTDRLILRVPAVDAAGAGVPASAVLLNRWRQPMRPLAPMEDAALPNTTQFDLPLAPLAPGEYSIRITATGAAGTVSEYISFRVQG